METSTTKTITYNAPDIECGGCAKAIQNALGKVPGIQSVSVDIDAKTVAVTQEPTLPPAAVLTALDNAGFPATTANA